MSDQCRHCTMRGSMNLCKQTQCWQHESWYATAQQNTIDELLAALERAVETTYSDSLYAAWVALIAKAKGEKA